MTDFASIHPKSHTEALPDFFKFASVAKHVTNTGNID
jgi:hypothetical protein